MKAAQSFEKGAGGGIPCLRLAFLRETRYNKAEPSGRRGKAQPRLGGRAVSFLQKSGLWPFGENDMKIKSIPVILTLSSLAICGLRLYQIALLTEPDTGFLSRADWSVAAPVGAGPPLAGPAADSRRPVLSGAGGFFFRRGRKEHRPISSAACRFHSMGIPAGPAVFPTAGPTPWGAEPPLLVEPCWSCWALLLRWAAAFSAGRCCRERRPTGPWPCRGCCWPPICCCGRC